MCMIKNRSGLGNFKNLAKFLLSADRVYFFDIYIASFLTLKYSTPVTTNRWSSDTNSGGCLWCSNRWSASLLSMYQARTIVIRIKSSSRGRNKENEDEERTFCVLLSCLISYYDVSDQIIIKRIAGLYRG